MIFKNPEKIISRGVKNTELIGIDDTIIKDVLIHIFDGTYNRAEILMVLSELETIQSNDFGYVKEVFDAVGLNKWYYQDLDGGFKVMCVNLILLLELNETEDNQTIVICPSHHNPIPSNKGISKGMKDILDEYKNLLKDYKEQYE